MSRYIDIEWLKTEFDEANEICFFYLNADSRGTFEELKKIVEQAPITEIVRCKECKHAHMTYDGLCKYCDTWKDDDGNCLELYLDGDYYCADGERKDEPQTCSFSDCDNFKNPDYERCIECKRKQIKLKTERMERKDQ